MERAAPDTPGFKEKSLWKKVRSQAERAGSRVIEAALTLFYVWKDPDTPRTPKGIIGGALVYFVLPIDVVPDPLPGVGYGDDVVVLLKALAVIAAYIKPIHRERARLWVEARFGSS